MTKVFPSSSELQLLYLKRLEGASYKVEHYPAEASCFNPDGYTPSSSGSDPWCSFQKQVSILWNHPTEFKETQYPQNELPLNTLIRLSAMAAFHDTKGPGLPGLALRLRAAVEAKQGKPIDIAEYDQKIIARRKRFIDYHEAMTTRFSTEESKRGLIQKYSKAGAVDFNTLSERDLEVLFTLSIIAEFLRDKSHEGIQHQEDISNLKECGIVESHDQKCSDCNFFALEALDLFYAVRKDPVIKVEDGIPMHTTLIVELEDQDFAFFDNAQAFLRADYFATMGIGKQDVRPSPPWTIIASVFSDMGLLLESQGNIDEAKFHYQRALDINPDHANIHYNLANLLTSQGDIEGAKFHYQRALDINPNDANAHNNLAVLLNSQGDQEGAKVHYQRALDINPDDAYIHNNLASLLKSQGDIEGAKFHYQEALDINPNHADIHYNFGLLLESQGDIEGAKTHYQRTLDIDPGYAKARNKLAKLLK